MAEVLEMSERLKSCLLECGAKLWWRRPTSIPVSFVRWRRRGEAAVVLVPHTGRTHQVCLSRLFRAKDAVAWEKRVSELVAAASSEGARRDVAEAQARLLSARVPLDALVRELRRAGRRGAVSAVLEAARVVLGVRDGAVQLLEGEG